MRRFNFLFLVLLVFSFSVGAGAEESANTNEDVGFHLFNDDFELSLEVGPAFLSDPIFESTGTLYPRTKINYDQPRYIGASVGWWINPYLLLRLGVNFTSADFSGTADAINDSRFNNLLESFFLYETGFGDNPPALAAGNFLSAPNNNFLPSDGCDADVISVFCATREPIKTEFANMFVRGRDEYGNFLSFLCQESCALAGARTAIMTNEAGNEELIKEMAFNAFLMGDSEYNTFKTEVGRRSDIPACGVDCQLTDVLILVEGRRRMNVVTRFINDDANTYNSLLEARPEFAAERDRIKNNVELNKERCYEGCIDARARDAVEVLIRDEGQTALDDATDRDAYIRGETEEFGDARTSSTCSDLPSTALDTCHLIVAEQLIIDRGQKTLDGFQTDSTTAVDNFIKGRPEYTTELASTSCQAMTDTEDREDCALAAARTAIAAAHTTQINKNYDDYIKTQDQYTEAFNGDCNENEVCALARAKTEIFNVYLRGTTEYDTAFSRADCDDACALTEAEPAIRTDEAGTERLNQAANDNDLTTNINKALRQALEKENIVPATTISATGTFLSVGSFLNAYGNYPITRTFSIYGGGGVGLAWTKIKDGQITRSSNISLNSNQVENIAKFVASELSITTLESDIETALRNLTITRTTSRDISAPTLSFAASAAIGFRTEVFEGLVLDTGYRMQWSPNLYEGADSKIIHQIKIGFVFRF